jgi:NTE family protein
MTRAFVLSGGGSYGALQVGALQVLLARGIKPDMVVGVSVGALNASWLAANPHQEGMELLARVWRDSVPKFFLPPNRLGILLRLAKGENSLISNQPLQRMIRHWSPAGATFGLYTWPRLYVVAARLPDGRARVFGDDPADVLFDGLMASASIPPLYSPWEIDGEKYVDGGVCSDLPLRVAFERGADEIYALHIGHAQASQPGGKEESAIPQGVVTIGEQALTALIHQAAELEIEIIRRTPGVRLHLLRLWMEDDPGFWDFTHAESLIDAGRRAAENYLADSPLTASAPVAWLRRIQDKLRSKFSPKRPAETSRP